MVAKNIHVYTYVSTHISIEYVFEFVFCMQALSGEFSCIRRLYTKAYGCFKVSIFEYTDGKLDR